MFCFRARKVIVYRLTFSEGLESAYTARYNINIVFWWYSSRQRNAKALKCTIAADEGIERWSPPIQTLGHSHAPLLNSIVELEPKNPLVDGGVVDVRSRGDDGGVCGILGVKEAPKTAQS